MRRHLIIGRLGRLDQESMPTATDEVATDVDLVEATRRLGFGLGQALDDLAALSTYPSEAAIDLAILAALVYAADTRVSRATESQDSWTREIRLVVPVGDTLCWNAAVPLLTRMLNFLTGDRWRIGFRPRPTGFEEIVRRPRRVAEPRYGEVSLFSGGLDSFIGAIDLLETGSVPLFVSHAGDGATSKAQEDSFHALSEAYSARRLDRLRVWMIFPQGLIRDVASDNTTRGRSFLFFALGVLAGSGLAREFTVEAPENGFIALNVPLDVLRLGSNSTRTVHPFFMACWNELLHVVAIPGQVVNRYWRRTKGEMIAECANARLLKASAAVTMSCSSPSKGRWHGYGPQHCGYCVPCLIRRAAFHSANWTPDPTSYTVPDLSTRPLNTREAEGEQVRSFQLAAMRLQRRPQDVDVLIHKPGPLPNESAELDEMADTYRRGLNEIASLLAGVSARPS